MKPTNQLLQQSFLKRLFSGWLGRSLLVILLTTAVITYSALTSDFYFHTLIRQKRIDPSEAFSKFPQIGSTETETPKPSSFQSRDCFVIVSGYVYNMGVRIGQTAIDPNTGKTHVHTSFDYACGTIEHPTDMTDVYLDKHGPMGCATRIAPFIVRPPAPIDPTCS